MTLFIALFIIFIILVIDFVYLSSYIAAKITIYYQDKEEKRQMAERKAHIDLLIAQIDKSKIGTPTRSASMSPSATISPSAKNRY